MKIRKTRSVALAVLFVLSSCVAPSSPRLTGRIVVEREADGNTDIYVMNADGTDLTRLTDDPAWDGTPTWSPDGSKIAFSSERVGGVPSIFVIDADGSNLQQLSETGAAELMPSWSPDGSKIAFASNRSYEVQMSGGRLQVESGLEIWVMNADGSNPERVTGNHEDQSLYPTWSPDGSRLAYMEIGDEVRVLSEPAMERGVPQILTDGLPGRHWTPAWSPDGTTIAIMAEVEGNRDIWLIRPEGGEAIRLTNLDSGDADPKWSPDGQHIVFVSNREGTAAVYIADLTGENVQRLTEDSASYARPDWTAR